MTPLQLLTHVASGRTDRVYDALVELAEDRDLSIEGASAIQWCAYYGDASAVRALLSAGANLRRLGEDLGLNGAAFHGHWQLCAFPLESGADANWTDLETGETPLHSAMTNEDRDRYDLVTRVLLAKGANPNKATIPGKETGAFMRDCRTKGETPLHRAAAFGTARTLQLLVNAKADLTLRDANGNSPLSWASWYRRPAEILGILCYGSHRVRNDYQGLRLNLLGDPNEPHKS